MNLLDLDSLINRIITMRMEEMLMPHTETDCGPSEPVDTPVILPTGWQRINTFTYRHRAAHDIQLKLLQ